MPELSLCVERGCGRMIPRGSPHTRCPKHAAAHAQRITRTKQRDPFYVSPAWRKLRQQVLQRGGWLCQIRGPGCTIDATEVDHITPRHQGGAPLDEDNCRASCQHCNRSRGRR